MPRLKIGVIGCGAIAQIQHLPHLRELDDLFEIGGLTDLSPKLLEAIGTDYGVPPERRRVSCLPARSMPSWPGSSST